MKVNVDDALETTPTIEKVLVVKRTGQDVEWTEGRDVWWHDIVPQQSADCPPEQMESEDMLYLLYTSGTTAKPKGILHTTGGYLTGVATTHRIVFDIKDDDVYWAAADIGWVTGHSYIVYGPLANGSTSVLYEGTPDYPVLGSLVGHHREVQGHDPLLRTDRHSRAHEAGAAVRAIQGSFDACACLARSVSRSIRKPGSGTTPSSARSAARSSTPGGRPRPA